MRSNRDPGGRNHDSEKDGEQVVVKRLEGEVKPGDCIWVKLHGNLWWPAQVVDENTVSESNKPSSRTAGAVLVRLYGTYEYLYADPIKCHSEFQIVLEQNNGSYREIFEKSLERNSLRLKSGSKGKGSKSKGKYKSNRPSAEEEVECKYSRQRNGHKKLKPNSPGTEEEATRKSCKQDGVQKKKRANNTSNEERIMSKISTHNEYKRNRTPKLDEKHNPSSPNSAMSFLKKSHELSARRLRVMQSLALVAPSGSPFGKNEQVYVSF